MCCPFQYRALIALMKQDTKTYDSSFGECKSVGTRRFMHLKSRINSNLNLNVECEHAPFVILFLLFTFCMLALYSDNVNKHRIKRKPPVEISS